MMLVLALFTDGYTAPAPRLPQKPTNIRVVPPQSQNLCDCDTGIICCCLWHVSPFALSRMNLAPASRVEAHICMTNESNICSPLRASSSKMQTCSQIRWIFRLELLHFAFLCVLLSRNAPTFQEWMRQETTHCAPYRHRSGETPGSYSAMYQYHSSE